MHASFVASNVARLNRMIVNFRSTEMRASERDDKRDERGSEISEENVFNAY